MDNKFYKSLKLPDVKKETTVTEDIEEYISNYIKNLPIEKQIQNVLISLRKDCKNILNNYEMVVRERDELSEKLDKECNMSLNIEGQLHDMTKQRDSLIKDVEKLRVLKDKLFFKNRHYEYVIKSLRLEVDNYDTLTEHIRDKALHNPSVSRYKDLVHYIDDLEAGYRNKVNHVNNWFKLKENIKHMIISVYPEVKEHVVDYAAGQFNILEELGSQIDELEGNHDIQNLLDDLECE